MSVLREKLQIRQLPLPTWAIDARKKFGDILEMKVCPYCSGEGELAAMRPHYQDFVAGKVDVYGRPKPSLNPLPAKIRKMRFETFQVSPQLRLAYEAAWEYAHNYPQSAAGGKGLLLYGPVGAGKTHLAASICNALIDRGFDVVWTNTPEFITKLKRSFDTGVNEATVMDSHIRAGLLVLDDIGSEKPTDWAESRLYEVINSRLEREAPIIFTSNCQADVLTKRLGQRIVSRIRGMSQGVQLRARDYRTIS